MSETFTAREGTTFAVGDDGVIRITRPNFKGRLISSMPLTDLLEFADSIERREAVPDKPEPPLSERTKLLAMMAATLAAGDIAHAGTYREDEMCKAAEAILGAVEKGGSKS